jgi:6-phosphogluconolactonase/glucosamine-6-phosphate isomerase/deaminase
VLYSITMHFILTSDWEEGIADLAQRLEKELSDGKRVLWLTSGGSNIDASVQVMDRLPSELSQNLSIMLGDERYGEVGHSDSNWSQLLQAGLNPGKAKVYPVLQADLSFDRTLERYNTLANQALAENDTIIGQLGIGTDGHIAGILPDSEAAHQDTELVAGYDGGQYKRLTLTFPALSKIDASYTFAYGESKRQALTDLQTGALELAKQPAQILRELPEAYIYNDQLEDIA